MGSTEKFCLRWNDFESNISGAFRELRDDKDFFDVTLACDEDQIQAHKVILSACSPFFRTVLRRNRHEHPLLYLKGVKYVDLVAVLNFMYHGEVNVAQEELNSFLAVAEDLKVKGLTQNNSDGSKINRGGGTSNEPPKIARPRDPPERAGEPTPPPPKRPRPPQMPPPAAVVRQQPSNNFSQEDDDIQEVMQPVVKSEPVVVEQQLQQQPEYQGGQIGGGVLADPNMEEYGTGEEYGDYGGYEGADNSYDGAMVEGAAMGVDGNKGLLESLLDAQLTEGDGRFPAKPTTSMLDSTAALLANCGGDVDSLLEQYISRLPGSERTDYLCQLCSKSCKSRDECANHIEVHHLKIVRSCPYCGIDQTSRGGLRQHISRKHREEHKLAKGNAAS